MKKHTSIISGLLVLLLSLIVYKQLTKNDIAPAKKEKPAQLLNVETLLLRKSDYTAYIESYGRVQAQTRSNLSAEVSGRITWVSPNLQQGAQFKKGEVLVSLHSQDYQAELDSAQAALSEARLKYQQELALSQQAKVNWERLALDRQVTNLVLRKPQLAAAKAMLNSAVSKLATAKKNVSRTKIRAPYDGYVIQKHVDVGEVINSTHIIAEVYDKHSLEIRLPIALDELKQLNLPTQNSSKKTSPSVMLTNELSNNNEQWCAFVVRSDAAIDPISQQLFVIAKIGKAIDGSHKQVSALKLNQYMKARIKAQTFTQAIIIPNKAISLNQYVYILDENSLITKREINMLWQDDAFSVINKGLDEGDMLITTKVSDLSAGQKAISINQDKTIEAATKPELDQKYKSSPDKTH